VHGGNDDGTQPIMLHHGMGLQAHRLISNTRITPMIACQWMQLYSCCRRLDLIVGFITCLFVIFVS
jgi:hypothetical protein